MNCLFVRLFSKIKAKEFWLALSAGILKNALHKALTVKSILSVGMGVMMDEGWVVWGV